MPTIRLSRDSIRKIREPGRYGDGGGLFLLVNAGGSRQWMARLTINGKRRDLGLGAASPDCGGRGTMTLDQARKAAARYRDQAQQGIDPKEQEKAERAARDAAARAVTFRDAAERVHQDNLATWKSGKHRDQWITTLRNYAFPVIAFVIDVYARRIVGWKVSTAMTTQFVLDALEQAIWQRNRPGNKGLIDHPDRGSQYLSIKYTERLAEAQIDPSVGTVGDNALTECVISLFKTKVIHQIGP